MTDAASLGWGILAPIFGAVASSLLGRRGPILAAAAAGATIGAAASIAHRVGSRGSIGQAVGGWAAPLGIELRADGDAALFMLAFGVVGALVGFSARDDFPVGARRSTFYGLGLFAWAGLDALLLSRDVFNIYVALELVTLTAVGLVALAGGAAAWSAALRYLLIALLGSLAYLAGVALLYALRGTLDLALLSARSAPHVAAATACALVVLGLGLKSALFPLHAWLPPAYASATPGVSALLSALLGKASIIALLRIWPEVFPMAGSGAAQLAAALGGLGVVWASLLAVRQDRLKLLLAYSSLAHVGYAFFFFPLGTSAAHAAVVYLLVSHAAASAAMFTAAGTIDRAVGSDSLDALQGVAHRRPLTFFAFGIAGASLMGLPPTGGFVAKWLLVRASLEQGQWWWAVLALAGGLIAAAYVFRILRSAFLPLPPDTRLHDIRPGSEIVSLVLALLALALGVAPSWPLAMIGSRPPW